MLATILLILYAIGFSIGVALVCYAIETVVLFRKALRVIIKGDEDENQNI